MRNEIQLISDGEGLALIGDSAEIDRFLLERGLEKLPNKDLGLQRLGAISRYGALVMETGAAIGNASGRWVQITEKSARQISQVGLMTSKQSGLSLGVVQASSGKIKGIVEFAHGPGSLVGNPLILSGAAGIMAQVAIQQQMENVVEYLKEVNEKADDIIRGQKDAVLADILSADLIIEEAYTVRSQVGRVSDITWSKVQATSMTIARSQAYALRQLEAIADKLSAKSSASEMADAAKEAEQKVREWLEVLARCIKLQDTSSILELDRVLDASPGELDQHRLGLATARRNRRELIARSSLRLLEEMDQTVHRANSKVLFNPFKSPAVVDSSNQIATDLHEFRGRIGIESGHVSYDAKQWLEAATEAKDKVLETTSKGVDAVRQLGAETTGKLAKSLHLIRHNNSEAELNNSPLSSTDNSGSSISARAADATINPAFTIGLLASEASIAVGPLFPRKKGTDNLKMNNQSSKETGSEDSQVTDSGNRKDK